MHCKFLHIILLSDINQTFKYLLLFLPSNKVIMKSILNLTYSFLIENYPSSFSELTINKVNFGVNLTYAELSDGSVGIASTLFEERIKPHKCNRDFGDFSPSKIKGQNVITLFETEKESDLLKSLKIAVFNAISGSLIRKNKYKILDSTDPIDLIKYGEGTKVCMVGAFRSYIEKIGASGADLKVLELN
ncbi:MAG: hypothetical protein C0596_08885 [Marinilabiliales bacterium]|nr:MAG: hypothetical protein C0596_08885 [Marinilabiliales bacterium]